MLILSRSQGQRILVGDKITIEVLEVRGQRARISVCNPNPQTHWLYVGDRLQIAADTSMQLTLVDGSRVRIGIDAPRSVRIDREEVRRRIEREESAVADRRFKPAARPAP